MNIQDIVLESEYNVLMSLSKSYEKEFLMESYYMEADGESKPGLLKRLVALCRGIINWIRKKIRRLFGKDDSKPVDPKPDLRDLKQLIDESSEEFSKLKDSMGDLEKASNETLADYLKAVEKMTTTVQQYLDDAEKEKNIANVQRCKEILEELAKANKNITEQISTNKENESVKEIVENLKKSFEKVGTPNGSVQGGKYISIRTLCTDFENACAFPAKSNFDAKHSVRADPERGSYQFKYSCQNGYCWIMVSAYVGDLCREFGGEFDKDLGVNKYGGHNHIKYGRDAVGREIHTAFGYVIKQSDLADGSIPQIDLKSLCKWAFDCFEATYFNNAHETNGEWDVTASSGDYTLAKQQLTELVSIDNIPVIRKE